MMINELAYHQHAVVEGTFRVHDVTARTARNNSPYFACTLRDRTGQVSAYVWLSRYEGDLLREQALMSVRGTMRQFADRWQVDIGTAHLVTADCEDPFRYIYDEYCPISGGVARLERLVSSVELTPLRSLLMSVVCDDGMMFPFLSLPASMRHHHAYPGGLLEHSLECAEFVMGVPGLSLDQRDLAVCAALLHDIGKLRTLNGSRCHWARPFIIHDIFTLELLAQPLAELDRSWPDGGAALRYLLSWKLQSGGNRRPLMAAVEIIQAADRFSCGANNEKTLFSGLPEWRQSAQDDTGRRAWRPALLHSTGR